MYALEAAHDLDVIQCVSYSRVEYVGDYESRAFPNSHSSNNAADQFIGDERLIDSDMAMFRLDHNDPTLTSLVIADSFYSMEERYGTPMMDVLNAVYMHPHLTEIIFAWDDFESPLWREDEMANDALCLILRDKPLITNIAIRTSMPDFGRVGALLRHCPQLKSVFFAYDGPAERGHSMYALMRPLKWHPTLEAVEFVRAPMFSKDCGALYNAIMKKPSMKEIVMIDTRMDHWLAERLVKLVKDMAHKCTHLTHISLFDFERAYASRNSNERHWQEEIDLQLDKITNRNLENSVKQFLDMIFIRDTDNSNKPADLKLITDVEEANDNDKNWNGNRFGPPDHLYALLRAKADVLKRCRDNGSYETVSNKRPKFN
jgi:hypothetical protein